MDQLIGQYGLLGAVIVGGLLIAQAILVRTQGDKLRSEARTMSDAAAAQAQQAITAAFTRQEQERADHEQRIKQLEAERDETRQKILAVTTEKDALRKELEAARHDLALLQTRIDNMSARLADAETRVKELDAQKTAAEDRLTTEMARTAHLQQRVTELETQVKERDAKLRDLELEMARLSGANAEMRALLVAWKVSPPDTVNSGAVAPE